MDENGIYLNYNGIPHAMFLIGIACPIEIPVPLPSNGGHSLVITSIVFSSFPDSPDVFKDF